MPWTYPHMCRDGHAEIGFFTETECPACRAVRETEDCIHVSNHNAIVMERNNLLYDAELELQKARETIEGLRSILDKWKYSSKEDGRCLDCNNWCIPLCRGCGMCRGCGCESGCWVMKNIEQLNPGAEEE